LAAVRWLTPPRQIAALVTATGTDEFAAELFHFGQQKRSMAAEIYLLAPGRYTLELCAADGGTPIRPPSPLAIRGPRTRIAFELPPGTLCALRIRPEARAE
jgi:hypothetical protein